ncbi:MAG: 50S ribosomal protein L4, partial [Gemmatimonadota bacterium]
ALEDRLVVIDPLEMEEPKTKSIVSLLDQLDLGSKNALFLTDGLKRQVYLSARNIPNTQVRPWGEASAYDILWADVVIVEASAFAVEEGS